MTIEEDIGQYEGEHVYIIESDGEKGYRGIVYQGRCYALKICTEDYFKTSPHSLRLTVSVFLIPVENESIFAVTPLSKIKHVPESDLEKAIRESLQRGSREVNIQLPLVIKEKRRASYVKI